jgi:guanylate kinase
LIQLARNTFEYSEYFKNKENKDLYLEFAFYKTNIYRTVYKKADEIKKLLELKRE